MPLTVFEDLAESRVSLESVTRISKNVSAKGKEPEIDSAILTSLASLADMYGETR